MTSCKKAKVGRKITGMMNRHRVSSLIGALGLPGPEQQLAFDHFGHSGDVNGNIYQVPQAERQLKATAKYLHVIDGLVSENNNRPLIEGNYFHLEVKFIWNIL